MSEARGAVVLVDGCRVPIGRVGGMCRDMRADGLLALCAQLVQRSRVDPAAVDEVRVGCVLQNGEQLFNVGRHAWLQAGLPPEVPGFALDMQCGSSQQAIQLAMRLLRSEMAQCVALAGVEVISRALSPVPRHETLGRPGYAISPQLRSRYSVTSQGVAAERIAEEWGIQCDEMDAFGVQSHQRAVKAAAFGRFESEFVHVPPPDGLLAFRDEGVRADYDLERARRLKPVFEKGGRITAEHASQVSDGASAALLCTEGFARAHGLTVGARLRDAVTVGRDPVLMLTAVVPATSRLLERAGLNVRDVAVCEINEAFASVVLAWQREIDVPLAGVNVKGGVIALGHPVGATGIRLLATLVPEVERRARGLGAQAVCAGLGIGVALLVEVS